VRAKSIAPVLLPAVMGRVTVNGWLIFGLFAAGVGVAVIPIFSDRYLSINDYLNHLARGAVLLNYNSNPGFAQFFAPNWQMLPNLALDVWILGFGQILPVEIAGKLFVAATLAIMLGGIICLHRVTFERWSLWPFLAILLLYNRLLLTGLLNFLFGIGLWLFILSLWIYLRPGRALIRASALTVGALAVFFVHLFAFGILAVTIAAYELVVFSSGDRPLHKRLLDLVAGGIPFLPVIAILVVFSPHSDTSAIFRYRDIWTRILGFVAPILYDWRVDAACFLMLFVLLAWAVLRRAIRVNWPLGAGVIALFALQFCMPNVIMTAEGGDRRIPIPMMLLAIAATDPKNASRQLRLAFVLATGAAFAFRIVTIQQHWSQDQPAYSAAWAALSRIPAGARVATAFAPDVFDDFSAPMIALSFIPVWNIVPQGGFTQTLFASPTQQPLVLTPKYAALAAATPPDAIWRAFVVGSDAAACAPAPKLISALRGYDYVIFVDRRIFRVCDTSLLQPEVRGRYLQVFRVMPGS
jgi:hypothetical protein